VIDRAPSSAAGGKLFLSFLIAGQASARFFCRNQWCGQPMHYLFGRPTIFLNSRRYPKALLIAEGRALSWLPMSKVVRRRTCSFVKCRFACAFFFFRADLTTFVPDLGSRACVTKTFVVVPRLLADLPEAREIVGTHVMGSLPPRCAFL